VDLPPGSYETLYFSYSAADLQPLAHRLRRRGVPFRIEALDEMEGRRLPHSRYELQVREAERQTAREELIHLLGADEDAHALDQNFDLESGAYTRCPGCGTDQSEAAGECPECGLMLGGAEEA
jgi:rubrerythrin